MIIRTVSHLVLIKSSVHGWCFYIDLIHLKKEKGGWLKASLFLERIVFVPLHEDTA
jgi:hypothetical protein